MEQIRQTNNPPVQLTNTCNCDVGLEMAAGRDIVESEQGRQPGVAWGVPAREQKDSS